ALYEEFSALLEDLGRLEAFFGQLRPVIGKALPEEEAEGLRLSMLEHLPQRPLRLGDVRLRLELAWRSGALPPGTKRRPFGSGRASVVAREPPPDGGEKPVDPPATVPTGSLPAERCRRVRVEAPPRKGKASVPAWQGHAQQAMFVWD
ncbi:MAG TPA: hypothetical protein VGD78_08195, partial [Chthoniobacterales bacterium]